MKQELIEKLNQLLKNSSVEEMIPEVETLENEFQRLSEKGNHELLEKLKAEGGEHSDMSFKKDKEDSKFRELINIFNDRKKKYEKQKTEEESRNLALKKQVIVEMKRMIAGEDQIGRAFQTFKELQNKWKNTGSIPADQYKQLQNEYSHQADLFFKNIKIYKELQEHDLRRNLELKNEIIQRMQELLKMDSIKKTEALVKTYQEEWNQTGPAPHDKWEGVRELFREATSDVYRKIRMHYEKIREQQNQNLQSKINLCEKIENCTNPPPNSFKRWQEKAEVVLQIQKEWRTIGFVEKSENERVWERFKKAIDDFFSKRKEFFKNAKKEYELHKQKKSELIEKAEKLKTSTEWKTATDELIFLQGEWKKTGPTYQKDEHNLWNKFRDACNTFFEEKKKYFSSLDSVRNENLKKKKDILQQIESMEITGEKESDLQRLKLLEEQWKQIDLIPAKEQKRLMETYYEAIGRKYDELKIDEAEKSTLRFINKVEKWKHFENTDHLIIKEKKIMQEKIRKLESEIQHYENNLGFFSNSKSTQSLKREVELKVNKVKDEVHSLKQKIKILAG